MGPSLPKQRLRINTPPSVSASASVTTLIDSIVTGVTGLLSSGGLLLLSSTGVAAMAWRTLSPEISLPKIV